MFKVLKWKVLSVSVAAAALAWAVGCQQKTEAPRQPSSQAEVSSPASMRPPVEQPATAPQVGQAESADPVVVLVNGEPISQSEVIQQMNLLARRGVQLSPGRIMDEIIARRLILQEAARTGQVASASEVEEALENLIARVGGREILEQQIEQAGTSLDKVRDDLSEQITINRMIEKSVAEPAEVTDGTVEAFYRENPELFARPETVSARHILIRSSQSDPATEQEQARQRIEDIQKRLKAGEDFSELARAESEDPGSAAQGGNLGSFPRGAMVEAFEEAAFSLKPGETSDIVQTPFGYHLIRVDEHIAAGTRSLDEVRDQLKEDLGEYEKNKLITAWIERLRAKAKIEYPEGSPMRPQARPEMPGQVQEAQPELPSDNQ